MITRYAENIIRYRWLVIFSTLILIAAAASGLRFFKLETNYRVFFDESNPQLQAFENMQNTYDKNDNVLIVLTPKQGNVFTPESLATIQWLTEQAWQTPYSIRVDSLTNYQHTQADGDDMEVADLVVDPGQLSNEELNRIQNVAIQEPLLVKRLISPDSAATGINISVNLPQKSLQEVPEVVAFVRDLKQQVMTRDPNMEVRLTGMVMMNNAFSEASQNDMATLTPLMFLVVIVVLGLMLRSISATLATTLMIFICILSTLGLFFWCGFSMTPPMASVPTIILTMAVADSVHLLSNFLWGMRQGQSKQKAMVESLRINFQPIFLTSLTTALGFMSMNFSDVPPLIHLGNTVAVGVIIAFLLSISFLPALVYVLPCKVKVQPQNMEQKPARLENLSHFVINQRKPLLWGITLISLLFIACIPKNQINDEFVKYFDPSVDFRADSDYAAENLIGPYTLEYSLDTNEQNGISDPQFLEKAQQFVTYLKSFNQVTHVYTLTDTMKRLNKNLHGDNAEWYRLPENRQLAAQYLLLYEMSLPYGLDLNNQIDMNKSSTRIVVTTENLSSMQMLSLEAQWQEWLEQHMPEYSFAAASPNLMFAHIGQRNAYSMLGGTFLALIMISLVLVIALRSVKLGLVSLIPNLIPGAIAFGLWGLIDGMVGMSLSIVAGMTLGIVVDDTVHFLSKYRRAYHEQNYSSAEAITYAFTHVGQALIITTLVLVAGFMIMTLSTFKMNADMGLLTAITISIALIIDFLLLPPLLMKLDELKKGKKDYEETDGSEPLKSATV